MVNYAEHLHFMIQNGLRENLTLIEIERSRGSGAKKYGMTIYFLKELSHWRINWYDKVEKALHQVGANQICKLAECC